MASEAAHEGFVRHFSCTLERLQKNKTKTKEKARARARLASCKTKADTPCQSRRLWQNTYVCTGVLGNLSRRLWLRANHSAFAEALMTPESTSRVRALKHTTEITLTRVVGFEEITTLRRRVSTAHAPQKKKTLASRSVPAAAASKTDLVQQHRRLLGSALGALTHKSTRHTKIRQLLRNSGAGAINRRERRRLGSARKRGRNTYQRWLRVYQCAFLLQVRSFRGGRSISHG